MEEKKENCVLSDGTKVYFDKHNIKPREWKSLFNPEQPEEEAERIMSAFSGLPVEKIHDLSVFDSQLLYAAAAVIIREPVDPNSVRAST